MICAERNRGAEGRDGWTPSAGMTGVALEQTHQSVGVAALEAVEHPLVEPACDGSRLEVREVAAGGDDNLPPLQHRRQGVSERFGGVTRLLAHQDRHHVHVRLDAREQRIRVNDPLGGAARAEVVLRPVVLSRLEALIETGDTAAATRERRRYAEWLCTGR